MNPVVLRVDKVKVEDGWNEKPVVGVEPVAVVGRLNIPEIPGEPGAKPPDRLENIPVELEARGVVELGIVLKPPPNEEPVGRKRLLVAVEVDPEGAVPNIPVDCVDCAGCCPNIPVDALPNGVAAEPKAEEDEGAVVPNIPAEEVVGAELPNIPEPKPVDC